MKNKAYFLSGICLCLMLALAAWLLLSRPKYLAGAVTRAACKLVMFGCTMMEPTEVASLTSNKDTSSLELNRKIALIIKRFDSSEAKLSGVIAPDGLIYDEWGSPLLIYLRTDALAERLNPLMKGKGIPFAIWSAGPNKENEFGFGDDVWSFLGNENVDF